MDERGRMVSPSAKRSDGYVCSGSSISSAIPVPYL